MRHCGLDPRLRGVGRDLAVVCKERASQGLLCQAHGNLGTRSPHAALGALSALDRLTVRVESSDLFRLLEPNEAGESTVTRPPVAR
jgi:hypothetical protein